MNNISWKKHNRRLFAPYILLGALFALALFTWIGSEWGLHIRNLMSADGVRWFVSNIMENIEEGPIALILLLMMTVAAVQESGLWSFLWGGRSLKRKRAFSLTVVVAIIMFLLLAGLTIGGNGVLLSPFGTIDDSPLMAGIGGLILFSLVVLADVFGYTSGRFSGMMDIITANVSVIRRFSYYFLGYVMAAELCACLYFSGMLNDDVWWCKLVEIALYLLPLC